MDININNNHEDKRKFFKIVAGFLGILAIFLVVRIMSDFKEMRYIGQGFSDKNVITVSGYGEAFAVPDIATFTFSVNEEDKTVKPAQDKVTARMNAVLEALKKLGIDSKDVQTVDYSVYPQYDYTRSVCTQFSCPPGKQVLRGYQVNQTVMVKIRKVEDSGVILGEMGKQNVSNISGLNFSIDDEDAVKRDARKEAIDEAREKAKELAKDLGVRLGRVVSFSESGVALMMLRSEAKAVLGMGGDVSAVPDVPVGQNKVTSNVTIVYEIR